MRAVFPANRMGTNDIVVPAVFHGERSLGEILEKASCARAPSSAPTGNRLRAESPTASSQRRGDRRRSRAWPHGDDRSCRAARGWLQCRRRSPRAAHAFQQLFGALAEIASAARECADALRRAPRLVPRGILRDSFAHELCGLAASCAPRSASGAVISRIEIDGGLLHMVAIYGNTAAGIWDWGLGISRKSLPQFLRPVDWYGRRKDRVCLANAVDCGLSTFYFLLPIRTAA